MNKSIALLAFVIAGQFSLAHAGGGVNMHLSKNDGLYIPEEVESGTIKSEDEVAEDHHPFLTDDPSQFEETIKESRFLVNHVDFSSVEEQTAPLAIEGKNFAVSLNGGAQVLTSYQGLPATYWFGDPAESAFVLVNGSVQIVFPQDVYAASLMIDTSAYSQKLQLERKTITDVKAGTILVDANGVMIGQSSITVKRGAAFLGVLSDIPFQSIIISSTSETWMFSNLNYAVDQERPMVCGSDHQNGCEDGPDYEK